MHNYLLYYFHVSQDLNNDEPDNEDTIENKAVIEKFKAVPKVFQMFLSTYNGIFCLHLYWASVRRPLKAL